MAIKFETFGMSNAISKQEVSLEREEEIAKSVAKADVNLREKMKKIARAEAEAWKKFCREG